MKQHSKYLLLIILFIADSAIGFAQEIEIRGGQTSFPGMYPALRYEHYSNSMINVAGGVFLENSKRNNLNYSAIGMDLSAQYKSNTENNPLFSYKALIGATAEIVNEPFVYKDWPFPQRINYGIQAEFASVIHLTEAFGLSAFVQQKFLFNKSLGTSHFIYGLGLTYKLGL